MARSSMKEISEMMADLDLCMLTTIGPRKITASRPMSNNGEVKYDGTSYFFTWKKSDMVKDIKKNNGVNLSFVGSRGLKKLFISVSGKAQLIEDKEEMEKHWSKDLNVWFKDGIQTPGVVMLEVEAKHIKYWHGNKEGELKL